MTAEDKLRKLYLALSDAQSAYQLLLAGEWSPEFPARQIVADAAQANAAMCTNIRVYKDRAEMARRDKAREEKEGRLFS